MYSSQKQDDRKFTFMSTLQSVLHPKFYLDLYIRSLMDLVSKGALKLREIFTINNQQCFITFLNA